MALWGWYVWTLALSGSTVALLVDGELAAKGVSVAPNSAAHAVSGIADRRWKALLF